MADEPELGRRPRWPRRIALIGCGLIVIVLLVPTQRWGWSGSFPSSEFRLRFQGAENRPIPGVRLQVFTKSSGLSHLYPIEEFVPGNTVVSDAEGRMTFTHFGLTYEYGGSDRTNWLGMQFRSGEAPQYDCAFFLGDREVYRIRYNLLCPKDRSGFPQVERPWVRSRWVTEEMIRLADAGKTEWTRLFDGNRDGQLDREERVAKRYFFDIFERGDTPKNVAYDVVDRTVVLTPR